MADKIIPHLAQGVGVGKDTPFQAPLERVSCTVVLEARCWRFRRDLSRGVGRNISGTQGDMQRQGAGHRGAWRGCKDVLG